MPRRTVSASTRSRLPRPTSTIHAEGSRPSVGTVSTSPGLPRSLLDRYSSTRSAPSALPASFTPGPSSDPSNIGNATTSARTSAGDVVWKLTFGIDRLLRVENPQSSHPDLLLGKGSGPAKYPSRDGTARSPRPRRVLPRRTAAPSGLRVGPPVVGARVSRSSAADGPDL